MQRYKQKPDRKRALVSRLLQYRCCEKAVGIPWESVNIKRTKGSKPFLANSQRPEGLLNFNFNVSHEGNFVALVSEPVCVCGVDIAAPNQLRPGPNEASLFLTSSLFGFGSERLG